jgi:hypothetical protein
MVIQLKNIDLLGGTAFVLVKFVLLEFCTVGRTDGGLKKTLWTDVQTHITKGEQ